MTAAVFALLMSTVTYQSESVVTTIRTLSDTAEVELDESGVDAVGDCKRKKMSGIVNWIKTTYRPWSFRRGINCGTRMPTEGRSKGSEKFALARCRRDLRTVAYVSIAAVGSNNRLLYWSIARKIGGRN